MPRSLSFVLLFSAIAVAAAMPSSAQSPHSAAAPAMQRLSGVWVEGPGYDIKYGADYDTCARRCVAEAKCVMIEYYRPEKKCNMYDARRPTVKGGSSDVAVKAL